MRTYAVIPAAGRASRMGRPKLLLPWGEKTVMEHVLSTWRASRIDRVIVVVHPLDRSLAELCTAGGAVVVQPSRLPADMKASVLLGLQAVEGLAPRDVDALLVAPADMPGLTPQVIDAVIGAYAASLTRDRKPDQQPRIFCPRHQTRRGHPMLLPWRLADKIRELAADEGLNALLDRHEIEFVDAGENAIADDFDTPEDYERLRAKYAR